jgi:hypothetical protein
VSRKQHSPLVTDEADGDAVPPGFSVKISLAFELDVFALTNFCGLEKVFWFRMEHHAFAFYAESEQRLSRGLLKGTQRLRHGKPVHKLITPFSSCSFTERVRQ